MSVLTHYWHQDLFICWWNTTLTSRFMNKNHHKSHWFWVRIFLFTYFFMKYGTRTLNRQISNGFCFVFNIWTEHGFNFLLVPSYFIVQISRHKIGLSSFKSCRILTFVQTLGTFADLKMTNFNQWTTIPLFFLLQIILYVSHIPMT